MKETFVKKHWDEEDILYYIHFQDEEAVRQLEISPNGIAQLTTQEPIKGEAELYDQALSELDLEEGDFISKEEFDEVWLKHNLMQTN